MINQQKTDFNGMIFQVMSVITKKPAVSFMPAGSDDIDVATFVSQAEKCISDNGGGKMPVMRALRPIDGKSHTLLGCRDR